MFHAAGWTFPWSAVFAFATQVRSQQKVFAADCRHADYHPVGQLPPHLAPSVVLGRVALLRRADRSGASLCTCGRKCDSKSLERLVLSTRQKRVV